MPKPIVDNKCNLCKDQDEMQCIKFCPVNVFEKGKTKSEVKRPDDCIGCRACEFNCPQKAIKIKA